MSKLIAFLRESKTEMTDQVTWTPFSELQSLSVLVLVASLIFALVIWAIDKVFETGLSNLYSIF
ncbi:MAG: preprotein translocase subunit SecE [Bernardetiaceae bacterium]